VPSRDLTQDEFDRLGPLEQRTVREGGGYEAITAKEAKDTAAEAKRLAEEAAAAKAAEEARIEAEEAAREAEEAAQLKAEEDAANEDGGQD
jgi:membrane protein involved in colicin uptake